MTTAVPELDYRIAETREDAESAAHLVYLNYLELGYCQLNPYQMHLYLYDILPDTRTLVAVLGDKVISTATLVFDSHLGLPSDHLYKDVLDPLRFSGRRIVEVSKLASDRTLGTRRIRALRGLFRLAWILSGPVRGYTDFCILTEPHHERFYEKFYLAERIGEFREDADANNAPSVLMRIGFPEKQKQYRELFGETPDPSNPYWFHVGDPALVELKKKTAQTDECLARLHQRQIAGGESQSASMSMRRYNDFRHFALQYNVEKIMGQIRHETQRGSFRKSLEYCERLLTVLPAEYEPAVQGELLVKMAVAAWYCGFLEHALRMALRAREISRLPEHVAMSHYLAAVSYHFLGRNREAEEETQASLSVSGMSSRIRAKCLRHAGRLWFDDGELDKADNAFREAEDLLGSDCGDSDYATIRSVLAHDRCIIAFDNRDILRARSLLEAGAHAFKDAREDITIMYFEAISLLENASLNPRLALDNIKKSLAAIDHDSHFHDESACLLVQVDALLMLGEIKAASVCAGAALRLARQSCCVTIICNAAKRQIQSFLASKDLPNAIELLEETRTSMREEESQVAWFVLEVASALIAMTGRQWDAAREACEMAGVLAGNGVRARSDLAMMQTRIAIGGGEVDKAFTLAAALPSPDSFPGDLHYESNWHAIQAAIHAAVDDEGSALEHLQAATQGAIANGARGLALEHIELLTSALAGSKAGPDGAVHRECRSLLLKIDQKEFSHIEVEFYGKDA